MEDCRSRMRRCRLFFVWFVYFVVTLSHRETRMLHGKPRNTPNTRKDTIFLTTENAENTKRKKRLSARIRSPDRRNLRFTQIPFYAILAFFAVCELPFS